MAQIVLTDAFVSYNSVDLSDHVRSVTLTYSSELQDDTAMGDTTRSRTGGLLDWSADVDFYADEASAKVAQTFFPLVGSTATLIVRPDNSDGVGATNPNYTGTAAVESIPLVSGTVGELAMSPVRFVAAGALSRATS